MNQKNEDLSQYYTYGLPLLGLMAVFAIVGLIATIVLHYIF